MTAGAIMELPSTTQLVKLIVLCVSILFLRRLILSCIWHLQRKIAYYNAQKNHGCRAPAKYPHVNIFGLDLFRERQKAIVEGKTVRHYDRIFADIGRTWQEKMMEKRIVNTIDPKNIQYILATGIADFRKIGQKSSFRTLLGDGIFLSNGAKWKFSRNLIKPTFARAEVSDLRSFGGYARQFMTLLPRDGSTVDVQPLMKKLFLDSSTEFIFGESMASMSFNGRHPVADDLLDDLSSAIQGINDRIQAWSRLQHFWDRSFLAAVHRIHEYIDHHVQEALNATAQDYILGEKSSTSRRFVLLHEMARQIRDPQQLRYEIINIFMASRDTISTLVSNCLFQLARHPEVWTELRRSVLLLGDDPDLSFERLKSLHDFRHVVNETFRTIGPTGKATRIAVKDTILPTGGGPDGSSPIFLPRGTFVVIPNNSLHHDRDIWGDDALEFRPSRWRDRKVQPWEFIPFVGGPRICPAQQMVTIQAIYILVLMVREFESIENRDTVQEYIEEAQLLLSESRNGVLIGLTSSDHEKA